MPSPFDSSRIGAAIDTLRAAGVVPGISKTLQDSAETITRELLDTVVREVPAFTRSGNPDVLPELNEHLALHIYEVCRLLAGQPPGELGFVREHAQKRAEQKFPLDALLAAYRCLHRTLATQVRDVALAAADNSAHVRRVGARPVICVDRRHGQCQ